MPPSATPGAPPRRRGAAGRSVALGWSLLLVLGLVACVRAQSGAPGGEGGGQPEADLIVQRALTFESRNEKGETVGKQVPLKLFRGQDPAIAAAVFIADYSLDPSQIVQISGFIRQTLEESAPDYVPDVEELRTAGAYSKRAAEHRAEDRHLEAAADLCRALLRPGLDPQAKERFEKTLGDVYQDHKKWLAEEAKAAEEAAKLEARQRAEEEAEEEAKRQREADEADWGKFTASLKKADAQLVTSMEINLLNEKKEPAPRTLKLSEGQDDHDAVFEFCAANGMHNHEELRKVRDHLNGHMRSTNVAYQHPQPSANGAAALGDRADKLSVAGQFSEAGADYSRALAGAAQEGVDGRKVEEWQRQAVLMMSMSKIFHTAKDHFEQGNYEAALAHLHGIQKQMPVSNMVTVLLMQARCNQQLGRWAEVVRVAGTLLQNVASRGSWLRGQPRMMAVSVGAQAAMEMGDSDKTLKFYQLVLRNDPDQKDIDRQYKGLKKVVKMLKEADDLLSKSKNHRAMEVLSDVLSAMKGMESASGMFRTNLLLRMCTANSELRRHEEALMACDQCVKQREVPVAGMFTDPRKICEALSARGNAHMNDHNYDEAVRDFKAAREYASGRQDEEQRLDGKIHEASHKKREWGERRDHRQVLELPVNLHQLTQDKQCNWIKKQHKLLARKWHPDKAKGNKERASRKMREVSEAKEELFNQLKC